MDKTIDIYVNGSSIRKNSNIAGVRGEGNATVLHFIFDEGWACFAKTVTFLDSRGENAVKRNLTADLLVDLKNSLLEYNIPIPPEAMAYEGMLSFIIDGYIDGVRRRSFEEHLKVPAAFIADDAGGSADPTPTQAEQLQTEIEILLGSIQEEAIKAQTAAETAESETIKAEEYKDISKSYAVGGTNTREGEDSDNAKYYASIAKDAAGSNFVTETELTELLSVMKKVYVQPDEPTDETEWLWLKTTQR